MARMVDLSFILANDYLPYLTERAMKLLANREASNAQLDKRED